MKKQHYLLLFLFSIAIISCSPYGDKVENNGTEVYYTDKVEKEDAVKLGEYLTSSGFSDGKKKSVQITKDETSNNYVFRMVVNPEAAKSENYDVIFKLVASQISDSVFNKAPVDFHVCNNTFKTLKTIPFGAEKAISK